MHLNFHPVTGEELPAGPLTQAQRLAGFVPGYALVKVDHRTAEAKAEKPRNLRRVFSVELVHGGMDEIKLKLAARDEEDRPVWLSAETVAVSPKPAPKPAPAADSK